LYFLFKEKGKGLGLRTTQIKVRLPFTTEKLPPTIVADLQARIEEKGSIGYTRGNIRTVYVDPLMRWKITIFLKEKASSALLLEYISYIIQHELKNRLKSDATRLKKDIKGIRYRSFVTVLPSYWANLYTHCNSLFNRWFFMLCLSYGF
jgi:hypothetical protein